MSRSYKHTPRCGDYKGKYSKRCANRAVRAQKFWDTIPRRAAYKKLYESWNICDYEQVRVTFEEFYAAETRWRSLGRLPLPDLAKSRNRYEKLFIRK